jgi:hypothetical protein
MARRVRQRDEHLPQPQPTFSNVIFHDRLAALEAVLVP